MDNLINEYEDKIKTLTAYCEGFKEHNNMYRSKIKEMNETTKKLAKALEQSKKRIQEYDRVISLLYGEEKMSGKTLSIIEEALAEYREQEKNPKTELVELDKDKIWEIANDCSYMHNFPNDCRKVILLDRDEFINKIFKTFGTKRVGVEDIKQAIHDNLNYKYETVKVANHLWSIKELAKAIHKLIYGKAVENEKKDNPPLIAINKYVYGKDDCDEKC